MDRAVWSPRVNYKDDQIIPVGPLLEYLLWNLYSMILFRYGLYGVEVGRMIRLLHSTNCGEAILWRLSLCPPDAIHP